MGGVKAINQLFQDVVILILKKKQLSLLMYTLPVLHYNLENGE